MPRHITVVYTIHDEEAAREELDRLGASFQAYDPINPPPFGISAMSNANEIRRLELIEEAAEEYEPDEALETIQKWLGTVKVPD
ncbi:hypothetical protein [Marinobacter sp.]|uniref:hypothetical protein n=1 Tax=Marinobacter sp. TaxID=50741 RepID=UPI0035622F25